MVKILLLEAAFCVTFLAQVASSFGLRPPIGLLAREQNLLPRASRDGACPEGYLCGQDVCSSNVQCPSGTVCINMEGTVSSK